jgi:patatin-like phospholipase/acyl hydrolase
MTLLQRLKSPGPKRLLALDGGGIRGALTAGYLVEMEKLLRQRHGNPRLVLADYFDFIGGTSTGSIIAAGLSLGMGAEEVSQSYLKLGGAAFKKVLLPYKARFSADAVREQLQQLFGDRLLGDPSLRTALCVVAKRADTNSVWPILNHPEGKYYARNSLMPLRDVVRASTAAPTYFIPETLDVGGQSGAFIDGGVSMANNPALTMFLVATLQGFPFHWKTGADQLLLVSLGTGQWRQRKLPQSVSDANIIASAAAVPDMLMQDANWQNQLLLQALSRSPTAAVIDREVGDLSQDRLTPEPLLSYLRYNATLEPDALRDLGLPRLSDRAEDLHDMSDSENRHDLLEVGLAAARRQLQPAHFPTAFDLPAADRRAG